MTGLAERLRLETRTLHVDAERSPFMAVLLRGQMERRPYVVLLRNLEAIYAALEPALVRHARHPALAPLDAARLARCRWLRQDLAALEGTGGQTEALSATTRAYVERLLELDRSRPELLLAHAYVRYLGDLSGGQLLRRIVVASPRLDAGDAVAFYDFGPAAAAAELARDFRVGLDRATVEDVDEVIAEAILSFTWHRRLFDELAEGHGIGS